MKKVLAVVLSLVMVLSLAACGGKKEETKAPETKKEETKAPESKTEETEAPESKAAGGDAANGEGLKIGVLIRTFSDTYTTTVRTFMTQYLSCFSTISPTIFPLSQQKIRRSS